MKKQFYILSVLLFLGSSVLAQKSNEQKAVADSLVNEWNTRFNSDKPELVKEILTDDVVEISGDVILNSRDSVMANFVVKRMPVVSELNALNQFYSVTDDMIYTAGTYTLKVNRSDGSSFNSFGNYNLVWTKQMDEKFRIEFIHIESVPRK